MRKICLFTGTRAEWGQLRGLAALMRDSDRCQLQLLVSGTHLVPRFGYTIKEIEAEGYIADRKVDIGAEGYDGLAICSAMGAALPGYGKALRELAPDILVVLGDRYEALCAVAAALVLRIPIAHIHGGEITEGALDDAFRHAITKMSNLHFPACDVYRQRILQLGEDPERVFNVGALAVENIHAMDLMTDPELAAAIDFPFHRPYFLVTFHPETMAKSNSVAQLVELLRALDHFPDYGVLLTMANADAGGDAINEHIKAYTAADPQRCQIVASLGVRQYLSAMKGCAAVVGNSSSGLLEAPVMGVPTVNIGDRQKGRLRTASIFDCESESQQIAQALRCALQWSAPLAGAATRHPCDQPGTARRVFDILVCADLVDIVKKRFHTFPCFEAVQATHR
jgi:UDP-hydrolysing UDP-N-acetyl-D-glucosamine 2-epimerase